MRTGLECPYCKEKIKSGATKCGHCQSEFDEPLRDRIEETIEEAKTAGIFAAMFVGGLLLFYLDKGFWVTLIFAIVTTLVVMVLYMLAKGIMEVVLSIYKEIKAAIKGEKKGSDTNWEETIAILLLGIFAVCFLIGAFNIIGGFLMD